MSKLGFKIGDKVKIIDCPNCPGSHGRCQPYLDGEVVGNVGEVVDGTDTYPRIIRVKFYKSRFPGYCCFETNMLEKVYK